MDVPRPPADAVQIFVPGRVCLVGEHSDWATMHRSRFPQEGLGDGRCIVYGTNCGVYASFWISWEKMGTIPDPEEPPPLAASVRSSPLVLDVCCNVSHISEDRWSAEVAPPPDGTSGCIVKDNDSTVWLLKRIDCEMSTLQSIASGGGFFSYICGVMCVLSELYEADFLALRQLRPSYRCVLHLHNWLTDLPVGKGLSSSAAVCVLTARGVYSLLDRNVPLTPQEEMEIAYQGERRTPSLCGKMDQCVAFGAAPVSLHFREDGRVDCQSLSRDSRVSKPSAQRIFYFVVSDLNKGKDTHRILSDLARCFEKTALEAADGAVDHHQADEHQRFYAARQFLCVASPKASEEVWSILHDPHGTAQDLGRLFQTYQQKFDQALGPLCPSELSSPALHALLDDPEVKRLSCGGKGVGSQGDGSVQLVCATLADQEALCAYLSSLGRSPMSFSLTA